MRILSLLFIGILFAGNPSASGQGVLIGGDNTTPDNSALLELDSDQKGLLTPRMTTAQRDAIDTPANGLLIYNTSTNCFNYRAVDVWLELCGACTPQPTTAQAGPDQLNAEGNAILAANQPVNGTGQWTIVSGSGGSFSGQNQSSDPEATFSGTEGESYLLQWTITNGCGSSSDQTTINFPSQLCNANPPGTLLIESSGWCDPAPPSGWTQCAGWLNTSGDDVSNSVLDGCLNSSGRLRIRIWNADTNVLEEDVYTTDADMNSWKSWDYHGGSVTQATYTNWVGTTAFFSSTGGGSACYLVQNCGIDAPCGTLTLGTGNQSVILAPGATNGFEYRGNCNGPEYVNRIIAVYK